MVFKKFDEQQVHLVPVIHSTGDEIEVGAVFSYNPANKNYGEAVTTKAGAIGALADNKELYLVAQSDSVTKKLGTSYKSYAIGTLVNLAAGVETPVAAYRITNIENVEWEA